MFLSGVQISNYYHYYNAISKKKLFAILKLISNFFLVHQVSPSPKIKKWFFRLPVSGDDLLSTQNITTFLAKLLLKLHLLFYSTW